MKRHFFTFALAVSAVISVSARDFVYGGINYTVLDEEAKTCSTKAGTFKIDQSFGPFDVIPGTLLDSSVLTIPETVNDGTADYTVVAIGECSFGPEDDYTNLFVTLPETIEAIGTYAFGEFSLGIEEINIPSKVTEIPDYFLYKNKNIKSLAIPANIRSIGQKAFHSARIYSVTFPEGLESIGESAFQSCNYNLTKIELPQSVRKIGARAFQSCYKVTELTLSDGIEDIGEFAFYYFFITSLTLPESVKTIGANAFGKCAALTSVSLPSTCESIDTEAFSGSDAIETFNVFGTGGLFSSNDGVLFRGTGLFRCPVPKTGEYQIPEGTTAICDKAFYDCSSLTSITIPESVTAIGEKAFDGCCSVKSFNLPAGLTKINKNTFSSCNALTSIEIPAAVEEIDASAFSSCHSLAAFTVAPGNKVYSTVDGVLFKGTTLVSYPAGKNLNEYIVPDFVTSIGNYAFEYSYNAYIEMTGLASVRLPEGLVSIGDYAFNGCECLSSINFPSTLKTIGSHAFNKCKALTEVSLPESLAAIGVCGFSSSYLESIALPDSLEEIGIGVFESCTQLKEVKLPKNLAEIPGGMFSNTRALNSIEIPASVRKIGSHAFSGSGLESVVIPEGVKVIAEVAFNSCRALTNVTLPASLDSIGDGAFSYCYKLERVDYLTSEPKAMDEWAFDEWDGVNVVLAVYEGGVEAAKTLMPWMRFPTIVGIPEAGVEEVASGNEFLSDGADVYTLDGRLLGKYSRSLPRGIYILRSADGRVRKTIN